MLDNINPLGDNFADNLGNKAGDIGNDIAQKSSEMAEQAQTAASEAANTVSEQASAIQGQAESAVSDAQEAVSEQVENVKQQAEEAAATAQERAEEMKEAAEAKAQELQEAAEQKIEEAQAKTQEMQDAAEAKANELKDQATQAVEDAKQQASEAMDSAKQQVANLENQATQALEDAQKQASDAVDSVKDKAAELQDAAEQKLAEAEQQMNDLKDAAAAKAAELQNQAEQAIDDAKAAAAGAMDSVKNKAAELQNAAEEKLKEAQAQAEALAAEAEQKLKDAAAQAEALKQAALAKAEEARAAAEAKAKELQDAAQNLIKDAGSAYDQMKSTASNFTKNPIGSFIAAKMGLPAMINRIKVNISSVTIKKFVDCTLSQPFDGHHSMELHLNSEDVNEVLGKAVESQISLKELTQKWAGEKITLTVMQGETNASGDLQQDKDHTFTGIVTGVQLRMKDAVNSTVVISGMSPTVLFNTGQNTRSFYEKTLSDIVNEVTKPFKGLLKINVSPAYSSTIPYITQYQEDNYHFLQRLADTYGEWFYYDGDEVLFGKSGRKKTAVVELEYGSNLTQMEYDMQLVPLTFKGMYYDYFKDENFESSSSEERINVQDYAQTASSKSDSVLNYETLDIAFQGHGKRDTLKQAVKFRKSDISNKLAVLKGTSTSLELRVGSEIKVKDDIVENGKLLRTDFYGSFIITTIHHDVDARGSYTNHFEAIPQDLEFPPVSYRVFQPKAETQPAKVVDVADEENMGRVKVKFYWQKDGESTPWIRVANMMSGQNQGAYFIPEKDEVVFIDFEFSNPDLPFVRGSMYHGSVKPGDKLFQTENNIKGIITKAGNHIIIDDSGGKEEIRIYNKDNQNEVTLSLSGKPHIDIKSKGKILFEAEEIEMKAKTIAMNADQEWKLETMQASVNASSSMKMESAQVDIKGSAKTSVSGGGQLALESSGQAALKGAIVMIN